MMMEFSRLTVLGDFNAHAEDAPDLTGAKSALITAFSSPSISHPKYTQATIPWVHLWTGTKINHCP